METKHGVVLNAEANLVENPQRILNAAFALQLISNNNTEDKVTLESGKALPHFIQNYYQRTKKCVIKKLYIKTVTFFKHN